MQIETIKCLTCEERKPLAMFYKNARAWHGHGTTCKPCCKIRERKPENRFIASKHRARYRGIEWSLTLEEYAEICGDRCAYCDGPLPETGLGMDRKDNSIGYTKDNCIPSCAVCNHMKHQNLSYEEMKVIGKAVAEVRKMRGLKPDEPILMKHQIVKDKRPYRRKRKGAIKAHGNLTKLPNREPITNTVQG